MSDSDKCSNWLPLPNFDFGQLFMWIGANNDQIWRPGGQMIEFEHYLNCLFVYIFVWPESQL